MATLRGLCHTHMLRKRSLAHDHMANRLPLFFAGSCSVYHCSFTLLRHNGALGMLSRQLGNCTLEKAPEQMW